MRTGVIIFPGSNCDRDVIEALKITFKSRPLKIWHKETEIPNLDLIIIPGGFSFGDYLRCGSIASKSPIINSIKNHVARGAALLGICNGFQILIETGLLPGALVKNKNLKFVCKEVSLIVQDTISNPFTSGLNSNSKLCFPIAHNEGNYFANDELIKKLTGQGQIPFKYPSSNNPNGSKNNIAGILSENGRILGMMPHPERAISDYHLSKDGKTFFEKIFKQLSM